MSDEEAAIQALVNRVRALENPPKPKLEDEPVLLLSERQIAHRLSISTRSVRRMDLPRYKIGRSIRYKLEDVDKYINRHIEYPASAYRPPHRRGSYPSPLPTWEEAQAKIERERKRGAER
jgi:hypothetical protein